MIQRKIALLALLIGAAACGDNQSAAPDAGPRPDAPPAETPLRAHAGGSPDAIALVGDHAYVGVGPRLAIWDLAATGGPRLLGESPPLRGNIGAIAVVGTRAYVAERLDLDSRLHVLDVSNPAAIRETADLSLATGATTVIRDLEGAADRLYVADQEQGVIELDLADPDAPARVRTAGDPGVAQLALAGTRLYAWAEGFGGTSVSALDVTDQLKLLGQGSFFGLKGVAIADGDLIVGAGVDGIYVYDATDPNAPVERYHFTKPEGGPFARAVGARGTAAWIPTEDGLYVLDLATPTAIVQTGPFAAPTVGVNAAATSAGRLAITTDRGRMLAFDTTTPTAPGKAAVTEVSLCADCTGVAVAGDTVYLTDIARGLRTAGLQTLKAQGASPDLPPQPDGLSLVFEDVVVAGTRAYVADWLYGLRIYDVASPAAITQVGHLDTPGAPAGVFVVDGRAYLGESSGGGALRVIDVADPAAPSELGTIATSKAMKIEVRAGIAYVADESIGEPGGLKLYDVSNPAAIAHLGTYDRDCQNARDVALAGDVAVVACGSDDFHLVDIRAPAAPVRLAVVPAPGIASAWSVAAWAGRAVLGHDGGILVIDLANPSAPVTVAERATATSVRSIAVPAPGHIVAAAGLAGVYQWRLD